MSASRDDQRRPMSIVKSDTSGNAGSSGDEAPKKTPRKSPGRAAGAKKQATAAPVATTEAAAPARKTVQAADPEMVILDPTHEEISLRAYEIYLARGRRDGHSDGDWVRAERELRAERERARLALRQPAIRSTTES